MAEAIAEPTQVGTGAGAEADPGEKNEATASPPKPKFLPAVDSDLEPSVDELRIENLKKKHLQLSDEVNELRTKLYLKEKELMSVKQELGLTPLSDIKDNLNAGIRVVNEKWQQVKESERYKKTGETLSKWKENMTASERYKKTMDALSSTGEKASTGLTSAGSKTSEAFKKAGDAIKENESIQSAWGRVRSATVSFRENITKPGTVEQQGGRPDREDVIPDES